jgi:hypothetical protein
LTSGSLGQSAQIGARERLDVLVCTFDEFAVIVGDARYDRFGARVLREQGFPNPKTPGCTWLDLALGRLGIRHPTARELFCRKTQQIAIKSLQKRCCFATHRFYWPRGCSSSTLDRLSAYNVVQNNGGRLP